jgi:hypothetical protein
MRIRVLAFLLGAAIALPAVPATAQRTRDRARLVFTVSGAYIAGRGLWTVPSQPVQDPPLEDNFFLSRSINGNFGASLSGTYFPKEHLGIGGEAFLIGLGYDDGCRLNTPPQSTRNQAVCQTIDLNEKSAAAVVLSGGVVLRLASRELISPFVRVNAGILIANQSPIQTEGIGDQGEVLVVYGDDKSTRVTPALALGVGATVPMGKGFGLRWEVRDQIIGIDRVTGNTPIPRIEPPHEQVFKHMFNVLIGVDVILERDRGRRY